MNRKVLTVAGAVLAVAFVAAWLASPLLAVRDLQAAVKSGDPARLERMVDFPSVREGLKTQLNDRLSEKVANDPEMRGNPLAGLALLVAPAFLEQAVETLVTPESIRAVVATGDPREGAADRDRTGGVRADDKAAEPRLGYRNLNTFTATIPLDPPAAGETVLVMKRHGLFGWKLSDVELPETLLKTE